MAERARYEFSFRFPFLSIRILLPFENFRIREIGSVTGTVTLSAISKLSLVYFRLCLARGHCAVDKE